MSSDATTIDINGQLYDAVSGLPVVNEPQQPRHVGSHHAANGTTATALHSRTQHSATLHRSAVKRPVSSQRAIVKHVKRVQHTAPVVRHQDVRKFAPHPAGVHKVPVSTVPQPQRKIMDIGHVVHPHVAKAHARSAEKRAEKAVQTASSIKEQAVRNAVEQAPTKPKRHKRPSLFSRLFKQQRLAGIVSAVVALVIFGGYLTYLNIPNLSVRIAAVQAGIDANFPSYHPDGYSLNGPVFVTDGSVAMNFKANAGPQEFTIVQSRSDWDNDAVLDHYVTPKAGADYIPYAEHGLTIYAFGTNAAWVNGGILYTIEGDAPLSSEQIRHIATSLL